MSLNREVDPLSDFGFSLISWFANLALPLVRDLQSSVGFDLEWQHFCYCCDLHMNRLVREGDAIVEENRHARLWTRRLIQPPICRFIIVEAISDEIL